MKRRAFVKNSVLFSASTFMLPAVGYSYFGSQNGSFSMLASLELTDFEDEQDESPILFQTTNQQYLITLRRLEYPEDKEIISLFKYEEGTWQEQEPVTPKAGAFEAICADGHVDGSSAIAFTEMREGQWVIKASVKKTNKFQEPIAVSHPKKRSINPVIKALGGNRFLLAWECFEHGTFGIYISKYDGNHWGIPRLITNTKQSAFHPALESDKKGIIFIAYDVTDGPHRNIEMKIFDSELREKRKVPIAIGGAFKNRVNINVKPHLGFDNQERLWCTWENNRLSSRLEDSDNYTGDRSCAMVCYHENKLFEQKEIGRWLFKGQNDHWPQFQKDLKGNLYVITHCGGDFEKDPFWKFRVSYLDPKTGWSTPSVLLHTKQKGTSIKPSLSFDKTQKSFWLVWKSEQFEYRDYNEPETQANRKNAIRRGKLEINQFKAPKIIEHEITINLVPTTVTEYHPVKQFTPTISGRSKSKRPTMVYDGEVYTLLIGNLHEHSEISSCWPAGTDGTLHDDYRYGLFSEGYDFMGITDHAYSQNEVYWRKHLRLSEFYNDGVNFVAFPSVEFTLSNDGDFEIRRGAGHRNILFKTITDAKKYIRDKDQVYSVRNPETRDAEGLWNYIHKHNIDCISIPHHPADEVHACCWETRDETLEPVVEIFQCRGNAEYRGAPRMINLQRHQPSKNDKGFIDYALREKKHHLGFIASGDHNAIGVGLACTWVKEISREGIMEALRSRRVFATTGDQIVVDFRLNGILQGEKIKYKKQPILTVSIIAHNEIKTVEVLRNSRVIKVITLKPNTKTITLDYEDKAFFQENDVLYYYIRITQNNNQMAWSSPIWMDT